MENKKELAVYSLQDKEIGVFECYLTSFDDSEAVRYFMNMFKDLYFNLTNDDDKAKFDEKLKNTCIYKLAIVNSLTGEFTNCKNLLVDYLTIDFIRDYFNKKDEVIKKDE